MNELSSLQEEITQLRKERKESENKYNLVLQTRSSEKSATFKSLEDVKRNCISLHQQLFNIRKQYSRAQSKVEILQNINRDLNDSDAMKAKIQKEIKERITRV